MSCVRGEDCDANRHYRTGRDLSGRLITFHALTIPNARRAPFAVRWDTRLVTVASSIKERLVIATFRRKAEKTPPGRQYQHAMSQEELALDHAVYLVESEGPTTARSRQARRGRDRAASHFGPLIQ
jgi:hypothetical protein